MLCIFGVGKMQTETLYRLNREMRSFFILVIINIVGAGLAMSLGVTLGANNLIHMFNEQRIMPLQAVISAPALVGVAFAIRWLVISAQVLDGFDDLRDECRNRSGTANGDTVTGLIVKNMSFYRDNKPDIDKLMLGSRITGAFFLLSGGVQIYNLLTAGSTGPPGLLLAAFGILICIGLGLLGVSSPSFFERYSRMWERRLIDSAEAEKKLKKILG